MDSISGDRFDPNLPELTEPGSEVQSAAPKQAEVPPALPDGAFNDSFELSSGLDGELKLPSREGGLQSSPDGNGFVPGSKPELQQDLDSSLTLARLHAEAPAPAVTPPASSTGEPLPFRPIGIGAFQASLSPEVSVAGPVGREASEPLFRENLTREIDSLVDRLSAATSWREMETASREIFFRLGELSSPTVDETPRLLRSSLADVLPVTGAAADLAGLTGGLAGAGIMQHVLNPRAEFTPHLAQPLFGVVDAALVTGERGSAPGGGIAAGTVGPPLAGLASQVQEETGSAMIGLPGAALGTPEQVVRLAFSRAESILTSGFQNADRILGEAEAQAKLLQESGLQSANQLRGSAAEEVRQIWEQAQQDLVKASLDDRPAILEGARQRADQVLSRGMGESESQYADSLARAGQVIKDGQLQALNTRRMALDHSDLLNRFAWKETKLLDLRSAEQEEVREGDRLEDLRSARQTAWNEARSKSAALVDHFTRVRESGEPSELRESALLIQGDRQALADLNRTATIEVRTQFFHHVQMGLDSVDGLVKVELAAKYGCRPEEVDLLGSALREGGLRISGDRELTCRIGGQDVPAPTLQKTYDQVLFRLGGGPGRPGLKPDGLAFRLGQKCFDQRGSWLEPGLFGAAGKSASPGTAGLAEALTRFLKQEQAEQIRLVGGGEWIRLSKETPGLARTEAETLLAEGFRQAVRTWDNQVLRRLETLRELGVQSDSGEPALAALPRKLVESLEVMRQCDRDGLAPSEVDRRLTELGTSAAEVVRQVEDLREGLQQTRPQLFQPR